MASAMGIAERSIISWRAMYARLIARRVSTSSGRPVAATRVTG